jgi:hypothetical protein
MYIHLRNTTNGVTASIRNNGTLSVGSESGRLSRGPFTVIAIDEIDGMENISTPDLIKELQSRLSVQDIMEYFSYQLSDEDIINNLKERLRK